ncbi:hypothetical protein B0O99DRAFT_682640 [Bisporella sp. PMI_857]|nr:hypothetical protein B0O99DRAFT_682640 [Bisporella sp. PMI_857]
MPPDIGPMVCEATVATTPQFRNRSSIFEPNLGLLAPDIITCTSEDGHIRQLSHQLGAKQYGSVAPAVRRISASNSTSVQTVDILDVLTAKLSFRFEHLIYRFAYVIPLLQDTYVKCDIAGKHIPKKIEDVALVSFCLSLSTWDTLPLK